MKSLSLAILVTVSAATLSPAARAWDSRCTLDGNGTECEEGPPGAFVRWKDSSRELPRRDEHRQLLELALERAGLDPKLKEDFLFDVFSAREGDHVPAPFHEVHSKMTHRRSIAEFALLPDYGFSLRDWATGFETCPPKADAPVWLCRGLVGMGGFLNSNHFLPQSRQAYGRYHVLAQRRADECREMDERMGGERLRFSDFIDQCRYEALVLEAIGQHFLQDSWSMGHMWQRWGTPELAGFPGGNDDQKLESAAIVAALTGLVHGFGPGDALAAPGPGVEYVIGERSHRGIGDFNLGGLLAGPDFLHQREALLGCSASGLLDVHSRATGSVTGPATALPAECFAARATNRALWLGYGVMGNIASGLGFVGSRGPMPRAETLDTLVTLGLRLWRAQLRSPHGTNMADGEIGPLLGVDINSVYGAARGPVPTDEAPLPWVVSATAPRLTPEAALTRMFHRAHATEWCGALARADLYRLRAAALGKGRTSGEALLCAEMAVRHLTISVERASAPLDPSTLPPDLAAVIAALGQAGTASAPGATSCEPRSSAADGAEPSELAAPAATPPAPDAPPEEGERDTSISSLCSLIAQGAAQLEYRVDADEPGPPTLDMAMDWCLRPECTDCPSIGEEPDPTFVEIRQLEVTPTIAPQSGLEVRWTLDLRTTGVVALNLHVSPTPGLIPGASALTNIGNFIVSGGPGVATNTETHRCERYDDGSAPGAGFICGNRITGLPYAVAGQPAYVVLEACAYCSNGAAQTCDVVSAPITLTGATGP